MGRNSGRVASREFWRICWCRRDADRTFPAWEDAAPDRALLPPNAIVRTRERDHPRSGGFLHREARRRGFRGARGHHKRRHRADGRRPPRVRGAQRSTPLRAAAALPAAQGPAADSSSPPEPRPPLRRRRTSSGSRARAAFAASSQRAVTSKCAALCAVSGSQGSGPVTSTSLSRLAAVLFPASQKAVAKAGALKPLANILKFGNADSREVQQQPCYRSARVARHPCKGTYFADTLLSPRCSQAAVTAICALVSGSNSSQGRAGATVQPLLVRSRPARHRSAVLSALTRSAAARPPLTTVTPSPPSPRRRSSRRCRATPPSTARRRR